MIYFAHRGANTQRVQNTVEAFALAQTQGAQYYELDVHLLQDGQLAVHHDYSLQQTAGKDVRLADLTATQLSQYPLHNPFTQHPVYVPLLTEVLPVVLPGLKLLNIEIKNDQNTYPSIEEKLLKILPQELLPCVLFSSFDYDTLARLRTLDPHAQIGLLTRNFDVQQALSLRAQSVHINYTRFTAQIARTCHEHNLKIYCYTVNNPALACQLKEAGADGIFTDDITRFSAQ